MIIFVINFEILIAVNDWILFKFVQNTGFAKIFVKSMGRVTVSGWLWSGRCGSGSARARRAVRTRRRCRQTGAADGPGAAAGVCPSVQRPCTDRTGARGMPKRRGNVAMCTLPTP